MTLAHWLTALHPALATGLLIVSLGSLSAHADVGSRDGVLSLDSRGVDVAGITTLPEAQRALTRAKSGDPGAQAQVGMLYERGRFLPLDRSLGAEWLARAAAQGVPLAANELAVVTYLGEGVPRDTAKAIALFGQAAAKGLAPAQASLGAAYAMGIGVTQDWAKALEWTGKAVEQNNALALGNLGASYQFGKGVGIDLPRAVALYRRAAALGDPHAQYNLGTLYEAGEGVPADPAQAFALYGEAARQGNVDGERALGMAYRHGLGTAKDDAASLVWIERAAARQDAGAEFALSTAYARGLAVPVDPAKAAEWERRAAGHGDGFAQLQRGVAMGQTPGPATDFAEVARLLTAALEQEAPLLRRMPSTERDRTRQAFGGARLVLGALYASGLGVTPDAARASSLMHEAVPALGSLLSLPVRNWVADAERTPADILTVIGRSFQTGSPVTVTTPDAFPFFYYGALAGNRDAQFELGRAYRDGHGTARNVSLANIWNLKAASQGQVVAQLGLSYQLEHGADQIAPNPAEAVRWLRKAADSGNALAEGALATHYRTGTGVAADPAQFRLWARKAAEQGRADAQGDLGFALTVGYGGAADHVEGLMWLLLEERGAGAIGPALHRNALANIATAKALMTPDQIAEAERRAVAEAAREAALPR